MMYEDIDTVVAGGKSLRLVVTDAEDQKNNHLERMILEKKTVDWAEWLAEVDLLEKAVPGYG